MEVLEHLLQVFKKPLPYVRGSGSLSEDIHRLIKAAGEDGMTDDELAEAFDQRQSTVGARRRELVLCGVVKDSGARRKTRRGIAARVWVADEGDSDGTE